MEKVLTTDVILIVQAMVNGINQCTPKSLTKLRNFKLCSWTRVSSIGQRLMLTMAEFKFS